LFYSVALWTLELDILGRNRRFGFFHQVWYFTSLRSSSDSFKLNCLQLQALHLDSRKLV